MPPITMTVPMSQCLRPSSGKTTSRSRCLRSKLPAGLEPTTYAGISLCALSYGSLLFCAVCVAESVNGNARQNGHLAEWRCACGGTGRRRIRRLSSSYLRLVPVDAIICFEEVRRHATAGLAGARAPSGRPCGRLACIDEALLPPVVIDRHRRCR